MESYQVLIILAVIAFIFEIFTIGFISGAIGIGLLFAAAGNYFDLEVKWQIVLFSIGVTLTYFLIRPIILKIGYKNNVKTNQDALIGKIGIVTEEINNLSGSGRISLDGDDWKAKLIDDEICPVGAKVQIEKIESIILIVKKI